MHGTPTFKLMDFSSFVATDSVINNPLDEAKQPGSSTSFISGLAPIPITSKFNDKKVGQEESN